MAIPELYVEVHPGSGPYALLVHGALASRSLWMRNLDALSQVCRPIVVQMWGHGGAPAPADPGAFSAGGYVSAFEDLRRRLGADRWFVCGQSMGGALVLHYALAHPQRVLGAVFTNSMSALAGRSWQEVVVPDAAREADQLDERGRPHLDRNAMNPARSTRLPAEVRTVLEKEWAEHRVAGIAGTFRWTVPGLPVRQRFGDLQPPTLLVQGMREESFAPLAAVARRKLPTLQVAPVDAAHAVPLQDPDGFNRAFCAFVTRHS